MKKTFAIIFMACVSLSLVSCVEQPDYLFDEEKQIEFETAVRTNPAPGYIFPIINATRTTGAVNLQINLIGTHLKSPEELTISVDTSASRLLSTSVIRAVEGKHFNLNGGKVTMKADTSFANFRFNIVNSGAEAGRQALLVLKLESTNNLKAAESYRRVGYRINLQ